MIVVVLSLHTRGGVSTGGSVRQLHAPLFSTSVEVFLQSFLGTSQAMSLPHFSGGVSNLLTDDG